MVNSIGMFFLILLRITSFIVVCPGFSYKGIPNITKVTLSMVFAASIFLITPEVEIIDDMLYFLLLCIKEVLLGLAMGFIAKLIFGAVEMAGQLIDFQVGFSMGAIYDPLSGTSTSNYGRVYYWLSICLFFVLDLHHVVIETLIASFEYIPIGVEGVIDFNPEGIVELFGIVFELALNLSIPMILVVLATDIVLGILSRTVPQINVLMLGMPLKQLVSYVVFFISVSWVMSNIADILSTIPAYLEKFLINLV